MRARVIKSDKERGDGRDYNRYVRCRVCGTINDTTRRSTGEGEGYSVTEARPIKPAPYHGPYDYRLMNPTLRIVADCVNDIILVKNDCHGDPITNYYTPREQAVFGGCIFCGSKNYR
jgi:hypothetical protein